MRATITRRLLEHALHGPTLEDRTRALEEVRYLLAHPGAI